MYTGSGGKASDATMMREAFDQSRSGAIILTLQTVFVGFQTGYFYFTMQPGTIELAAAGDEQAALYFVNVIYFTLYFLIAGVAMLFAWLMRSRIAMVVGLLLFALNWANFAFAAMAGQFAYQGLVMNVAGPIFLVRGFIAAGRYHRLRRTKGVDPEVFA